MKFTPDPLITAEVVADNEIAGSRITSLHVVIPRFILAEMNTHRIVSKNTQSSRARSIKVVISELLSGRMFTPKDWIADKKGMFGDSCIKYPRVAEAVWKISGHLAVAASWTLMKLGVHKQLANRLTEPFQYTTMCTTATEWANFIALRTASDSQPQMQDVSVKIRDATADSTPRFSAYHLPYVSITSTVVDMDTGSPVPLYRIEGTKGLFSMQTLRHISAARIARTSYENHDSTPMSAEKDLKLSKWLIKNKHLSPYDQIATYKKGVHRHLKDWVPWRVEIEEQNNIKCSNLN